MPQGRLWITLAVLAALAGRAAAQTAPNTAGGGCEPSSCAAAPRVKVIMPPPEVVFCPAAPQRGGLFHHAAPCPAPCATCAPPAVAAPAMTAPGGGLMNFNMTYTMPTMTYQMTPVMMGSAFGGAGLSAGMFGMGGFGMGGIGMPMAQPAAVNVGLGGLQMGLSGSALAAALGLAPAAGLSATGTSAAEIQALRALLGRAAGGGAAEGDVEARMRRLSASVAELTTRINNELANVQQMRSDMDLGMRGLAEMTRRLAEMDKRLKALEPPARNRPE